MRPSRNRSPRTRIPRKPRATWRWRIQSDNHDYWSMYSYILLHPRVSSAHFQKHFPAVHYSIDFKRSSNSSILCTGIAESVSHDLCLHSTKINSTAMEFASIYEEVNQHFIHSNAPKSRIWEIVRIKKSELINFLAKSSKMWSVFMIFRENTKCRWAEYIFFKHCWWDNHSGDLFSGFGMAEVRLWSIVVRIRGTTLWRY